MRTNDPRPDDLPPLERLLILVHEMAALDALEAATLREGIVLSPVSMAQHYNNSPSGTNPAPSPRNE